MDKEGQTIDTILDRFCTLYNISNKEIKEWIEEGYREAGEEKAISYPTINRYRNREDFAKCKVCWYFIKGVRKYRKDIPYFQFEILVDKDEYARFEDTQVGSMFG